MSYHNSSNSSSPSSPRKRVASTNAKNTPQNNTQRKAAPPGYHYMPDGSLMSDSQMGASQTYGNRPKITLLVK